MPVRIIRKALLTVGISEVLALAIGEVLDSLDDDLKDIDYEPGEKTEKAMRTLFGVLLPPTKELVVGKIDTAPMIPPDVIARDIAAAQEKIDSLTPIELSSEPTDEELDAMEDEDEDEEDE